ncbi:MAG: seg [candidate division CPR2 bacterium GW2011_GWC1_39_9]|uniref:NLP/P60 protein n=1 Tax=candidate division CPR2 bacterium GW2011_GWC2_39_10 TaxID=1618345 RepID=A0A0G0P889_UNCC2|nr:MAG: NLP/P60 protein [candidate division CPR2 bacterium GW2011_GWC2_39_10]KKR36081.1 MAG: seg [candidate division CPR2 bacterium GW2011_GWC1_39_9]
MKKLVMVLIIMGLLTNGNYAQAASSSKQKTLKLPISIINVADRKTEVEQRYNYQLQIFEKQSLDNMKSKIEQHQVTIEKSLSIEQALKNAGYKTEFASLYQKASEKYQVPWQVIAAVHIVESHQSNTTNVTSYAGAVGPMQFLPSTFRAYAQDGNNDGVSAINNVYDAVYSGTNYLRANGAANGNLVNALYRYNHSLSYVNHVLDIAGSLGLK